MSRNRTLGILAAVICSALATGIVAAPMLAVDAIEAANGLEINLGTTSIGVPLITTVNVTNPSADRELAILGFSADDEGFAIEPLPESIAPGASAELPIALLAETSGEFELIVRIYRDLGPESTEDPMITFAVKGIVTPP